MPADEAHQSFALEFINTKEGCLSSEEKLWRTEDGGRSWRLIFDAGRDEQGLPNPILGFQFVNSRTGWVLTFSILHDFFFNTRLYRTANGGRTWRRIARRAADHFSHFRFTPDGAHGWAVGTIKRPIPKGETHDIVPRYQWAGGELAEYAAVFYTKNQGRTWRRQSIPPRPNNLGALTVLDAEHAWAWGDSGVFYLDQGRWREVDYRVIGYRRHKVSARHFDIEGRNPYVGATDISFVTAKVGWMPHSQGYLSRSIDGGRTWRDILDRERIWGKPSFPARHFERIHFIDLLRGWALDENNAPYRTKDGGATWMKIHLDHEFSGWDFSDAGRLRAVAKDGLFEIKP